MNLMGRVAAGCAALALAVAITPAAGAEEEPGSGEPGMCQGYKDPDLVLNAHATGGLKYILNLTTDAVAVPSGVLILGRSPERLYVDEFCRVWQHLPGRGPGDGHEPGEGHAPAEGHEPGDGHEPGEVPEGATLAHAVGFATAADGARLLVRTDVRETEEGAFFRVRYRVMGQHGGSDGHDSASDGHDSTDGGHDSTDGGHDESWIRVPAEGWAPLDTFKLRSSD